MTTVQRLVDLYGPSFFFSSILFLDNPCVDSKKIILNSQSPITFKDCSHNTTVPAEWLIEFLGKENVDFKKISLCWKITVACILKYPDEEWNWSYLSHNENSLTLELWETFIDKFDSLERDGRGGVSKNLPITIEIIEKYKDHYETWIWGCGALSDNKWITVEFIEKYINKGWCWRSLSSNRNLTHEFIERHLKKQWDWGALSCNPIITLDFVLRHPKKNWCWWFLSANPSITVEDIEKCHLSTWTWGRSGLSQDRKSVV